MLTPLVSVLFYLRTHEHDGSVLAFVNDVVEEYLAEAGVALAGDDVPDVGAVFVAHQDVVDFPKLERAARALLHGAPLLSRRTTAATRTSNGRSRGTRSCPRA